jgi:hypothetical protein
VVSSRLPADSQQLYINSTLLSVPIPPSQAASFTVGSAAAKANKTKVLAAILPAPGATFTYTCGESCSTSA